MPISRLRAESGLREGPDLLARRLASEELLDLAYGEVRPPEGAPRVPERVLGVRPLQDPGPGFHEDRVRARGPGVQVHGRRREWLAVVREP